MQDESFNVHTCTEKQLRKRCREHGFSAQKTKRAVQHFVLKLPHCEIDPIRPKTSEIERHRMKSKLKNKPK